MKKTKADKDLNLYWRITPPPSKAQLKIITEIWGDDVAKIWNEESQDFSPEEKKLGFTPWVDVCASLELSAKLSNDPCFGLGMALTQDDGFSNTGPIVHIFKNVKSTRQILELAIRYQKLHTNGFSLGFEEDFDKNEVTGTMTYHPMSGPHRQSLEQLTAIIYIMAHRFIKDFEAKRITLQHRPPENLSPYKRVFGDTPVIFNATRNTIVADLKYLNLDHNSLVMSAIHKSVDLYLNQKIKKHPYAKKINNRNRDRNFTLAHGV